MLDHLQCVVIDTDTLATLGQAGQLQPAISVVHPLTEHRNLISAGGIEGLIGLVPLRIRELARDDASDNLDHFLFAYRDFPSDFPVPW